jgi:hypothetical protein
MSTKNFLGCGAIQVQKHSGKEKLHEILLGYSELQCSYQYKIMSL